jgi:hypothetical protein
VTTAGQEKSSRRAEIGKLCEPIPLVSQFQCKRAVDAGGGVRGAGVSSTAGRLTLAGEGRAALEGPVKTA